MAVESSTDCYALLRYLITRPCSHPKKLGIFLWIRISFANKKNCTSSPFAVSNFVHFILYHLHLIHRSSFHLHASSIFFVYTFSIDRACGPVNIRIAEKQIVRAASKYCNSSWYQQRQNALVYQSFNGADTYIFPKYAPR